MGAVGDTLLSARTAPSAFVCWA